MEISKEYEVKNGKLTMTLELEAECHSQSELEKVLHDTAVSARNFYLYSGREISSKLSIAQEPCDNNHNQ